MKRVLADLHHFDLYYSLYLMLRKLWKATGEEYRLYRPIGREWLEQGYWGLSTEPIVIEGYLGTDIDLIFKRLRSFNEFTNPMWARYGVELLRLLKNEHTQIDDDYGICQISDISKGDLMYHSAITLPAFQKLSGEFQFILSTVPHHFPLFEKLRRDICPQVHHIFQAGNRWDLPVGCQHLMSNSVIEIPSGLHNVMGYHQEFDTNVFCPGGAGEAVYSYVHYPESAALQQQVWQAGGLTIPFSFVGKTLGPVKDIIVESRQLARKIQSSAFTWHIKPGGEGYGHILHNSFACGTPVITSFRDYKDFIGLDLLEDGVTAIDTDRHTKIEIAHTIADEVSSRKMREKVYQRFQEVVNFEKEFNNCLMPFWEPLL
jgi:hypothetical protein